MGLVTHIRRVLAVLCFVLLASKAGAQEEEAAKSARRLFEEGVQLSESGAWSDAAARFESSLLLADRPGTRFNLIRAYSEMRRPLDVARHALAFLALPAEPHRMDARAACEAALAEAEKSLATLLTDSLPAGSIALIDGQEPVAHDVSRVFVLPGLHRLEARVPGGPSEIVEIQLEAGGTLRWPRQGRSEVVVQPQPNEVETGPMSMPPPTPVLHEDALSAAPSDTRSWRRRVALTTGTVGAVVTLAAVGTYAFAIYRRNTLPGAEQHGYVPASTRYERTSNAVVPLAISGALIMASAVLIGPHSSHWGGRLTAGVALGAGAALLATGLLLIIARPSKVEGTNLDQPSRQLGTLLASGAAPLVSYGVSAFVHFRGDRRGVSFSMGGSP